MKTIYLILFVFFVSCKANNSYVGLYKPSECEYTNEPKMCDENILKSTLELLPNSTFIFDISSSKSIKGKWTYNDNGDFEVISLKFNSEEIKLRGNTNGLDLLNAGSYFNDTTLMSIFYVKK